MGVPEIILLVYPLLQTQNPVKKIVEGPEMATTPSQGYYT